MEVSDTLLTSWEFWLGVICGCLGCLLAARHIAVTEQREVPDDDS